MITPHAKTMLIIAEVAREHGVTVGAILGPSRGMKETRARWEAIRRVHRERPRPLNQLGKLFNRDHSTIMYALKRLGDGYNAWEIAA